ncbi:hypothetical protein V1273_001799 [Bradyrhizobium sp. AZCC 1721]
MREAITPQGIWSALSGRNPSPPLACSRARHRYLRKAAKTAYATIFCSSAINASGAVTFGEWLASIS